MLRLNAAQKSMLVFEQLQEVNSDPTTYYHTVAIELTGKLDPHLFYQATVAMTKRHAVLRAKINADGTALELIADLPLAPELETKSGTGNLDPSSTWPMVYIDATKQKTIAPIEQLATTLAELKSPAIYDRFDFYKGPLWRCVLVKFSETHHQFCGIFHHIIFDVASQNIFLQELSTIYNALQQKTAPNLSPTLALTEIIPDEKAIQSDKRAAYWHNTLKGVEPTELKPDFATAKTKRFVGDRIPLSLPSTTTTLLKKLAKHNSVTLHQILFACLYTVLYRYTWQKDLCIATVSANRRHYQKDVDNVINCFVNSLPVRLTLSGDMQFTDLLATVKAAATPAYQNQISLADIMENKGQRIAIPFKGIFVFNETKSTLTLTGADGAPIAATYPIELNLHHAKMAWGMEINRADDDSLRGFVDYDSDLYDRQTMESFVGHFQQICNSVTTQFQRKLIELPMLSPDDIRLLNAANNTDQVLEHKEYLPAYFSKVAKEIPKELCTVFVSQSGAATTFTYEQFDELTNAHAAQLQKQSVGPNRVVAICTTRNHNLLIATMAAIKAGGTVIQLENKVAEQEARQFKIKDAEPIVVIVDHTTKDFFPDIQTLLNIEEKLENQPQLAASYRAPVLTDETPIYITYTSGTTGQPKGAINMHGGIRNLYHAMLHRKLARGNTLVTAPATFDAMYVEYVIAITSKGCAVMIYEEGRVSKEVIAQVNKTYPLHIMILLPKILDSLDPKEFPEARDVTGMGEPLTLETILRWLRVNKGLNFRQEIGFSEVSGASTNHIYLQGEPATCVGKPIDNTKIFLLDPDQGTSECPPNVIGEMYVAGPGVALGYLKQPVMTQTKFLAKIFDAEKRLFYPPEPDTDKIPLRLYKTGDLAYRLREGSIVFTGRIDHYQIKINGVRIELTGVAALLRSMPEPRCKDTLVITNPTKQYLIAYLILENKEDNVSLEKIHAFLAQNNQPMQAYPRALKILNAFPLTKNGKVDVAALPAPDLFFSEKIYPPTSELQKDLRDKWASVLKQQETEICVRKSFKAQGGDSFAVTFLRTAIDPRRERGFWLTYSNGFNEDMTIESLETLIRKHAKAGAGSKNLPAFGILPAPQPPPTGAGTIQGRVYSVFGTF